MFTFLPHFMKFRELSENFGTFHKDWKNLAGFQTFSMFSRDCFITNVFWPLMHDSKAGTHYWSTSFIWQNSPSVICKRIYRKWVAAVFDWGLIMAVTKNTWKAYSRFSSIQKFMSQCILYGFRQTHGVLPTTKSKQQQAVRAATLRTTMVLGNDIYFAGVSFFLRFFPHFHPTFRVYSAKKKPRFFPLNAAHDRQNIHSPFHRVKLNSDDKSLFDGGLIED